MSQHETDVFVIKSRCNSFHKETYKVTVLRLIHTELRVQSGISLWFIIVSVNWAKLPWAICLGPTWDPFQANLLDPHGTHTGTNWASCLGPTWDQFKAQLIILTWNPYWAKLDYLHRDPFWTNIEPI